MATNTNTDETEKSTGTDRVTRNAEVLRREADDLRDRMHALADAIEAGDADTHDVDDTIRLLATAYVPIEDAAHTADVIDSEDRRHRAMNHARRVVYRLTTGDDRAALDEADQAAGYIEAEIYDDEPL